MMKKFKVTVSLVMAAIMVFAAGCSSADLSWGAEYKGEKAPVGVYIMGQLSMYNKAMSTVEDPDKDPLKQDVEGKKGSEWVAEKTTLEMARYFALIEKFEEAGLKLTDAQLAELNELMEYQYGNMKDMYTKNGISESSLRDYYTNYFRSDSLFDYYYGAEGKEPVSTEEYNKYLSENYTASLFMSFTKLDDENKPLDEAGLAKVRERAGKYLERAKEEGADFNALIIEWEEEVAKEGQPVHEHDVDEDQHTMVLPNENSGFPKEYIEGVKNAKFGETVMVENDNFIMIIKRVDLLAKPKLISENLRLTVLHALRDEQFGEMTDKWAEEILPQVTFNEAAVKKYTANKLKFK